MNERQFKRVVCCACGRRRGSGETCLCWPMRGISTSWLGDATSCRRGGAEAEAFCLLRHTHTRKKRQAMTRGMAMLGTRMYRIPILLPSRGPVDSKAPVSSRNTASRPAHGTQAHLGTRPAAHPTWEEGPAQTHPARGGPVSPQSCPGPTTGQSSGLRGPALARTAGFHLCGP